MQCEGCNEIESSTNSSLQLIHNNNRSSPTTNVPLQDQGRLDRGSRLTRSLMNTHNPPPVHTRSSSLDNPLDKEPSIHNQCIHSMQDIDPISEGDPNPMSQIQGVYTIPILPDYSSVSMDQYNSPSYPPPKYPTPPRYNEIINTIDHFDDDEFYLDSVPTTSRVLSLYSRRSSTSTTGLTMTTRDTNDETNLRVVRTILLACIVFWLCGFLFGGLAIIFSAISKRYQSRRKYTAARIFNEASYFFSISGLMIGFILIVVVTILFGSMIKRTSCPPHLCWS